MKAQDVNAFDPPVRFFDPPVRWWADDAPPLSESQLAVILAAFGPHLLDHIVSADDRDTESE